MRLLISVYLLIMAIVMINGVDAKATPAQNDQLPSICLDVSADTDITIEDAIFLQTLEQDVNVNVGYINRVNSNEHNYCVYFGPDVLQVALAHKYKSTTLSVFVYKKLIPILHRRNSELQLKNKYLTKEQKMNLNRARENGFD